MSPLKKRMLCRECGSDAVLRDAYASWSEDDQTWALNSVLDHSACDACGATGCIEEEEEEEESSDEQA